MVYVILLANTWKLLEKVSFGSSLHMLYQPSRERQNYVNNTLMLIIEFITKIIKLGVRLSQMAPWAAGRILLALGVASRPTMVGVPMQVQGASIIPTNYATYYFIM